VTEKNASDKRDTTMRFLADRMLGKLAMYLRMLGYDTAYQSGISSEEMSESVGLEGRIILTRDTRLARKIAGRELLFIEDDIPLNQLRQVAEHFQLKLDREQWFSLCLRCNERLVIVQAEDVAHLVPSYILAAQKEFSRCPRCERVYWKGTHRERMEERIRKMMEGH